jgi:hypothetical protein
MNFPERFQKTCADYYAQGQALYSKTNDYYSKYKPEVKSFGQGVAIGALVGAIQGSSLPLAGLVGGIYALASSTNLLEKGVTAIAVKLEYSDRREQVIRYGVRITTLVLDVALIVTFVAKGILFKKTAIALVTGFAIYHSIVPLYELYKESKAPRPLDVS